MGNVLAINNASKEAVEAAEREVMREEFRDFVKNDPEVRLLMLDKVNELISGMTAWDISYHSGFKEMTCEILRDAALRPQLEQAITKVLTSDDGNVAYRITEAVGEYLAGKITMKISEGL